MFSIYLLITIGFQPTSEEFVFLQHKLLPQLSEPRSTFNRNHPFEGIIIHFIMISLPPSFNIPYFQLRSYLENQPLHRKWKCSPLVIGSLWSYSTNIMILYPCTYRLAPELLIPDEESFFHKTVVML